MYKGSITDIKGISVGCAQDEVRMTGCTAVLFDGLVQGGVDVRGGGPGTINTDALSPDTGSNVIDCFMLAGGSAFGLGCADGAMRFLEEHSRGFDTGIKRVPMVSGAIIYDLGIGDADARPDSRMGYEACKNASSEVRQGSAGAGMGATVGKALMGKGMDKCGQGTASITLENGVIIGALAVVNALGDVYEGDRVIAGLKDDNGDFIDTVKFMEGKAVEDVFGRNTTISVIATNAALTPGQTKRLAMVAHDGYAMAIRPVHTLADGDTVFAASTGEIETPGELNRLFSIAAEVMRRAIVNAALSSEKSGRSL